MKSTPVNKRKTGKNLIAVGMVTMLITVALSYSASSAPGDDSVAEASAVTGTGLFGILDTGVCEAGSPSDPNGDPAFCGPAPDTNGINAFEQNASASSDGTSEADASIASTDIIDLETTLDITELIQDLAETDQTGPITTLLGSAGGALATALAALNLGDVAAAIDEALGTAIAGVDGTLPLSIRTGEVFAECSAEPGDAEGSSTIADLDLLVQLGNEQIAVPLTTGTDANSNLLVDSPQELADGIFDGIRDTFTITFTGLLSPLNVLIDAIENQIVDPLLTQLEPTLLDPLADAIEDIISGTVNKQEGDGDEIEVTALELRVLGETGVLKLARVSCGPNNAADDDD